MNTLIIDDEWAARARLRSFLEDHPNINIMAEVDCGAKAVHLITELKPDLVFIDIMMPDMNGIEVIRRTSKQNFQIVIVSAYDEYALAAFDVEATDYLLKPIRPERLDKTLKRLLNRHTESSVAISKKIQIDYPLECELPIRHGAAVILVSFHQIAYIEKFVGYTKVHLNHQGKDYHKLDSLLSDTPLQQYLQRLPKDQFTQTHRGYVVNNAHIVGYRTQERKYYILLREFSGTLIPISRSHRAEIKLRWPAM